MIFNIGCEAYGPMDLIFALPDQAGIRDTDYSIAFIEDTVGVFFIN
jgi:hypothetical protein